MTIDPITFMVLKNAFVSVSEEMRGTLRRSSFSINMYERGDCTCVVYDPKGHSIIEMGHLPAHLGAMSCSIEGVIEKFGGNLHEGDMVMINDPYRGTTHLPDIVIFSPVYYQGGHVGFVGSLGHHTDIGGMRPGSMPGDATEIIQEGIRFPGVKICRRGEVSQDIVDILLANTRVPAIEQGDIYAQINANRLGIKRICEIIDKYGKEPIVEFMNYIQDYAENRFVEEIRKMKKGTFVAEGYIDIRNPPHKVRVTLTVRDDSLEFDFTGSDEETRTCFNTPRALVVSGVQLVLRSITDPTVPYNSGIMRRVKIYAPDGTIVHPRFPTAVAGASECSNIVIETLYHVFHSVLPGRVAAGNHASGENFRIGGIHPRTGQAYIFGEPSAGGYGAGPANDGENALVNPQTGCGLDAPVEYWESTCPVSIERYELITDSGGAGKYRGGLGVRRDLRILDQKGVVTLTTQGACVSVPPYPLEGGGPGATGRQILNPGTEKEAILAPVGARTISPGDVFSIRTPGGGGYGDPLARDMEQVRQDVFNGYVSFERAEADYGVAIDPKTCKVDHERTRRLRARFRKGSDQ